MTDNNTNKALLVVSFGTTHEETRAATIDAIESHLAAAFPDRKLYRGWTSGMIVRRLRARDARAAEEAGSIRKGPQEATDCMTEQGNTSGVVTETLEEALARMAADGMSDVLVQPTHIIGGEENDRMKALIAGFADRFERITVGAPLLTAPADLEQLAEILAAELLEKELQEDEIHADQTGTTGEATAARESGSRVLILMGHGSADKPEANQVYTDLEQTFRTCGHDYVLVATVEGTPTLEDVLVKMDGETGRTIILAPLMVVAGDHAKNDMAGDDEDSWKNRLEAAGFRVIPVLRGLGEYPAIREMFAEHARQALKEACVLA